MGDQSAIQWTDATWNPVVGCSPVTPGCKRCYAMREAHRLARMGGKVGDKYAGLTEPSQGGPVWNGTVRLHEDHLDQPLRWKRPRKIFVNSMSDLFHEALPDAAIDRVFAVMALAPQHTFQVLTKRSERMREYFSKRPWTPPPGLYLPNNNRRSAICGVLAGHGSRPVADGGFGADRKRVAVAMDRLFSQGWPLPNVWLGVSAEDQRRWNERREDLRDTPAAIRFVSAEPMLSAIGFGDDVGWIDQIIVGGESGPGARDFHADWAYDIINQCRHPGAAAVYIKQLGARVIWSRDQHMVYLRHRKGGDWNEWPKGLRVRDFPAGPTELPWDD